MKVMMKKYLFFLMVALPALSMAQAPTTQRTPQGAQCQIYSKGNAGKIKTDDVITFNVIQKTDKDSVLFNSWTMGHPIKLQVQPTQNVGDLMQVFPLLAQQDSAIVRVPTDSVFAGHEESRPPFLPKGSNMVFVVKIEKVQSLNDAIAERNAAMDKMRSAEKATADKYIADHKLDLKSTTSGLRYVITRPSVKRKVISGDTLLVNYAGRTTNDKLFDSSIEAVAKEGGLVQPGRPYEPLKLVVGQGQVIRGWDEGLLLLNEGSKATFVIPSELAYGEQGAGDDIGPFSTLIFDVDVVKIIPAKAKAAKPGVAKAGAAKPATGAKTPAKTPAKAPAKAPAKKAAAPVKK